MIVSGKQLSSAEQLNDEADRRAADQLMLEIAARGLHPELRGGDGIFAALELEETEYRTLASKQKKSPKFGEPSVAMGISQQDFQDHLLTRSGQTRVEALTAADLAFRMFTGQTVVDA